MTQAMECGVWQSAKAAGTWPGPFSKTSPPVSLEWGWANRVVRDVVFGDVEERVHLYCVSLTKVPWQDVGKKLESFEETWNRVDVCEVFVV